MKQLLISFYITDISINGERCNFTTIRGIAFLAKKIMGFYILK